MRTCHVCRILQCFSNRGCVHPCCPRWYQNGWSWWWCCLHSSLIQGLLFLSCHDSYKSSLLLPRWLLVSACLLWLLLGTWERKSLRWSWERHLLGLAGWTSCSSMPWLTATIAHVCAYTALCSSMSSLTASVACVCACSALTSMTTSAILTEGCSVALNLGIHSPHGNWCI